MKETREDRKTRSDEVVAAVKKALSPETAKGVVVERHGTRVVLRKVERQNE